MHRRQIRYSAETYTVHDLYTARVTTRAENVDCGDPTRLACYNCTLLYSSSTPIFNRPSEPSSTKHSLGPLTPPLSRRPDGDRTTQENGRRRLWPSMTQDGRNTYTHIYLYICRSIFISPSTITRNDNVVYFKRLRQKVQRLTER